MKNISSPVLVFLFLLFYGSGTAQKISPLNKKQITDSADNYTFIVSGHFYGGPSSQSTFPASTLLAGIDTLNSIKPLFLMSLGDMFIDVDQAYIHNYQKSLFRKLNMPLFNSVGNHDLSNDNMYSKVFGDTFFSFKVGAELFIVLNSEMNDGDIRNEQLLFFKNAIKQSDADSIKNVFVFSHRPVWAENNVIYKDLFKGNTRSQFGKNNFENEIRPLLAVLSKKKNVYWMSGSMAEGPASFFYHKEPETGITFIQTAIRDLPRDAVLKVSVNAGSVSFDGISLTGKSLEPVESYDINYWVGHSGAEAPFNYRLLPYMTLKMLTHYYFWSGFFFCFILILFYVIIKRWRRKK